MRALDYVTRLVPLTWSLAVFLLPFGAAADEKPPHAVGKASSHVKQTHAVKAQPPHQTSEKADIRRGPGGMTNDAASGPAFAGGLPEDIIDDLREEMEKYLGVRYKRGGTTSDGFDCSGFVKRVYKNLFNVDLPHSAASQFPLSILSQVGVDQLCIGDLLFFSPTGKRRRISHVGIYLLDGRFIHAARGRGIVISSLNKSHWRARLVSAKRVNRDFLISAESDLPDSGGMWQNRDVDQPILSEPVQLPFF